jgi:hypothetical protein
MRIDATGETMIFRKEYEDKVFYSTSLGQKKQDGEWENASIDVKFKKGVNLADKTKINVTSGWLKFWLKGKIPAWQIFINEFEQLSGIPSGFKPEDENQDSQIPSGFRALEDDDDIPF